MFSCFSDLERKVSDLSEKFSLGLARLRCMCPEDSFEEFFLGKFHFVFFADIERKVLGRVVKTAFYVSGATTNFFRKVGSRRSRNRQVYRDENFPHAEGMVFPLVIYYNGK